MKHVQRILNETNAQTAGCAGGAGGDDNDSGQQKSGAIQANRRGNQRQNERGERPANGGHGSNDGAPSGDSKVNVKLVSRRSLPQGN